MCFITLFSYSIGRCYQIPDSRIRKSNVSSNVLGVVMFVNQVVLSGASNNDIT
jgi:hypothetical protein